MRLSVRLAAAFLVVAWGLAIVVTLAGGGIDEYVVLLLIGTLVLRELMASGASHEIRGRVGLLVFVGVVAFVLIVVRRVGQILNL